MKPNTALWNSTLCCLLLQLYWCSVRWTGCFVYQLFQASWRLNTALPLLALGSFTHSWGGGRNVCVKGQPCSKCILKKINKRAESLIHSSSMLLANPNTLVFHTGGRRQTILSFIIHTLQLTIFFTKYGWRLSVSTSWERLTTIKVSN